MKIIYTDTAKEELQKFLERQQENLEAIVRQDKYVFGDDVVEVTASDIRQAEKRFIAVEDRFTSKYRASSLVLKVYFVLGIIILVYGLFYDQIRHIYEQSPKQFMIMASGLMLSLFSLLGNYFLKVKIERRKRYEELIAKEKKKEECQ